VRTEAAKALAQLGDARAVEPFIEALQNWHAEVRVIAAEALSRSGKPVVDLLIGMLKDEDPEVRAKAVAPLGRSDEARAVEFVIQALQDADVDVRTAAASALGQSGNIRAVEPFIEARDSKDFWVRMHVAEASGAIGDVRAVEPLIGMLRDKNWQVQMEAAKALGEIGDIKAAEPLLKMQASEIIVSVLMKIGKSTVQPFIDALSSGPVAPPECSHPLVPRG
jgi:HEAT repeat protein